MVALKYIEGWEVLYIMVYITGDTHSDFNRYISFANKMNPIEKDVMIVLGDAGINYYKSKRDEKVKKFVNDFPFTTFCIHGNHEIRPEDIPTYKTRKYRGGIVWYEEKYPKILFAKDGEIYDFDGYSCLVIGGAYSVDKFYRLMNGWAWFFNEQPSDETKVYVENQLKKAGNKIDIILSHTCPKKYEPTEVFLKGLEQSLVDKSTEEWLDKIEQGTDYKKWYCGHFHTKKKIDRLQFMFEDIDVLSTRTRL